MKKIFAFVGSGRNNSSTLRYVEYLVSKIRERQNIEVEIVTNRDISIEPCKGCLNCFVSHCCPLDKVDAFQSIKQKMQEADFIILASPVYLHNVTGGMKSFVDRLSYWSHIFALRGKNSMAIAVSGNSGTEYVRDYLIKVLHCFGCPVIDSAEILQIRDYDDALIDEHVNNIICALNSPIKSNVYTENNFKIMKAIMLYRGACADEEKDKGEEYLYWKREGLLEVDSLDQLLSKMSG